MYQRFGKNFYQIRHLCIRLFNVLRKRDKPRFDNSATNYKCLRCVLNRVLRFLFIQKIIRVQLK